MDRKSTEKGKGTTEPSDCKPAEKREETTKPPDRKPTTKRAGTLYPSGRCKASKKTAGTTKTTAGTTEPSDLKLAEKRPVCPARGRPPQRQEGEEPAWPS